VTWQGFRDGRWAPSSITERGHSVAGNSKRKGAIKKTGKGNPTAGSGGRVRRGLEGRGPTPKAKDRPYHQAHKAAKRAEKERTRTKRRTTADAEWAAGRNSVVELLQARVPVSAVYVAEGAERDGRMREAFKLAAEQGLTLLEVTRNEMDRMTGGAVHQGLAARLPAYEYAHADDLLDRADEAKEPALVVALDSVTDPRNLGAVIRSAAGFGAHGVLIPERRAAGMTASAWKTSAGAAARLPVAQTVNLTRQLKAYQEAGCMVVGLAADGDLSLPELVAPGGLAEGPLVVVVGSEGKGLGRLVAETCDQIVSIPMAAQLESLNAGVAASVALYAISQARTT
jgi:23S rRNA (guanosine2251-2'-O)-methyltransferase